MFPDIKLMVLRWSLSCFADDNLILLQGDKIELILQMLVKIGQYRFVAGLILNLVKCKIITLNCHAPDIQRIVHMIELV